MGIIGDLISAGSTLAGAYSQIKTNDLNYQLQRENLEYQKALQNTIFGREDTAVQRRVADLKAAGLSPTLAAGSAASAGQAISTRAPEKRSNLEALSAIASVRTLLAQQQEAQTQADIAKQKLEQDKMNTGYLKRHGLSPMEVKQGWQQRMVNLLAPKVEEWLSNKSNITNVVDTVKKGFQPVNTGNLEYSDGKVTRPSGESLTVAQASLLKQKGLYSTFVNSGFTPAVVDALKKHRSGSHRSSSGVLHGGGGSKW